jgi:hypothetical protein
MTNLLRVRTAWVTMGVCLLACSSEDDDMGTSSVTRELKSALARQAPAPGVEVAAVKDLADFAGSFYAGLEKPGPCTSSRTGKARSRARRLSQRRSLR